MGRRGFITLLPPGWYFRAAFYTSLCFSDSILSFAFHAGQLCPSGFPPPSKVFSTPILSPQNLPFSAPQFSSFFRCRLLPPQVSSTSFLRRNYLPQEPPSRPPLPSVSFEFLALHAASSATFLPSDLLPPHRTGRFLASLIDYI